MWLFLKVWLFKFIIDSSPPLKNKWGSGEQSAVSSRSNFVALTCLQIKRGKLPAGGEVAERSEELRKRESGLRFMIELSVPPSAAFFLKASPIRSLRLHRQAPTIQSILIAHRSWSSRIAHQWSLWLSLMLFAFLFNCWTRVRLNEGRVQTAPSITTHYSNLPPRIVFLILKQHQGRPEHFVNGVPCLFLVTR